MWIQLNPDVGELALHTTGKITWTTGLQAILGDPKWVSVFWNAEERWLGIRSVNMALGFPVSAEPEGSEFMIDTADVLAAAGVSVEDNVSDTPTMWKDPNAETNPLFSYPYSPIYYIIIPE